MSKPADNRFLWSAIGHKNIISYLQNSINYGNLAHAYLFVGSEHIGKATVAKDFITSLVCGNLHQDKGTVPCGECDCCRQINNKIHPDVYWLSREVNDKTDQLKKNISIEQIRSLQDKLNLHSFFNSYKIAIIDEAETLNQEAANSLLKTLEEPTPKTIIILLAHNAKLLPSTLVSRCQVLKFLPVDSQELFDYLLSLKVERKKAKILTALALGRPGIALNYYSDTDTYDAYEETVKKMISLARSDISQRFKLVGELVDANDIDGLKQVIADWQRIGRDLVLIKNSLPNLVSNLNLLADLDSLAKNYNLNKLVTVLGQMNLAVRYLSANVNPKLAMENLVLNF